MKLISNQACDSMGPQSTQSLAPILDGAMRNTRDGRAFVRRAMEDGVKAAVTERDAPFADYSQGAAEKQPLKKKRPQAEIGGTG
jgi:enoyl-CoA hydratase